MKQKNVLPILLLLLLAALAWKLALVLLNLAPFNADEAIVALMARHILQGHWSIFFYGQSYMGSLDAILVALGFAALGQQVWVIRLVQSLLFAGFLATTYWLGVEAFRSPRVGLAAVALLAIPTVNATLYTTASLGGYGEALLLGNLLLALAIRLARNPTPARAVVWGCLAGLGLWANGLTLVYAAPAVVFIGLRLKQPSNPLQPLKYLLLAALGGVIGATPWWIYAVGHGFNNLILELLGSAVAVEQAAWLERTGMHLVSFILLGIPVTFGLRPPWSVSWLALPLIPLALAAWGFVLAGSRRLWKQNPAARGSMALLGGVMLTLIAGFLFTAFGVDPSGRYFLPLAVPLALLSAVFIVEGRASAWLRYGALGVLALYQLAGNVQAALTNPPGFTTQFHAPTIIDHRYDPALMRFLSEKGETRGYTHYWVAYPLAFQSEEKLIFTPELPYHQDLRYTRRDNRYAPYNQQVAESERTAYITTRNPALDEKIVTGLQALGVGWSDEQIGDYHVYYALTRAVRPAELGLGQDSP